MTRNFIIGTRGSDLALWQANYVRSSLEDLFPERSFEIKVIKTTGDERLDVALSKIGDKGLFTRQIETELQSGSIDLAVHSLKDLQTEQPEGLVIGAVCEREVPNDVFISRSFSSVGDLPQGAKVATGSLRRRSQLLNLRPDLEIAEIRGNVPTRLKKFDESDLDAMILAFAGVHRLGLGNGISHLIPFDIMLPAVGQGAVAVEVRADDEAVRDLTDKLDHGPTRVCVTAERAFLRHLEGGCQVPIGAYATIDGENLKLEGMVGSLDGALVYRESLEGTPLEGDELGIRLAEILIEKGAAKLLAENRIEAEAANEAVI
ncbi:MAG TPA: hydroxymethylbilane synthase [Pyrinomonadaceae bacterium]|nr:hydroxymethylbilane synthase [Pyrinomonadaceae bacterium]